MYIMYKHLLQHSNPVQSRTHTLEQADVLLVLLNSPNKFKKTTANMHFLLFCISTVVIFLLLI